MPTPWYATVPLTLGVCVQVGCAAPPATQPRPVVQPALNSPVSAADNLESILVPAFNRYHTVGLVAAEVSLDEAIVVTAIGERSLGSEDALQVEDAMPWASATKWLTAMALVELMVQGRIDLQWPLRYCLPELATDSPVGDATLWQLLAHRSGLPADPEFDAQAWNSTAARESSNAVDARRDAANEILRRPGQQAPGLHTVYTDDGYTLAVVAVEAKLGEPWEVLLPAVLAPLIPASQAATIGFGWPTGPDLPRGARGHALNEGRTGPQPPIEFAERLRIPKQRHPGEGVSASVPAVASLAKRHLEVLAGRKGVRARQLYQDMYSNLSSEGEPPMGAAGMTLRLADGDRPETHYVLGSLGTFFTVVAIVPDRDTAYVLATNIGRGGPVLEGLEALMTR